MAVLRETKARQIYVALSGGMDSVSLFSVMLSLRIELKTPISVIHVDHNLHERSQKIADFCTDLATKNNIKIISKRISKKCPKEVSVEDWAREQRYFLMKNVIETGSLLITAHHADDQQETVLARILSGAGPHGLRGMEKLRNFHGSFLSRPFLDFRKEDIKNYANVNKLNWMDDPTNDDLKLERNRIRKVIVPFLSNEFPGFSNRLLALSKIQDSVVRVIDQTTDNLLSDLKNKDQLNISLLIESPSDLRTFILKRFLYKNGLKKIRQTKLLEILRQVITAGEESNPLILVDDWEIRRFQGQVLLRKKPNIISEVFECDLSWNPKNILRLPWGELKIQTGKTAGISNTLLTNCNFTVSFRKGGERFHPHDRGHSTSVKKLFQEWKCPPWERSKIPFIYMNDKLISIGNYPVDKSLYISGPKREAFRFVWNKKL